MLFRNLSNIFALIVLMTPVIAQVSYEFYLCKQIGKLLV